MAAEKVPVSAYASKLVDVTLLNPPENDSVTKIGVMLDQKMEKLVTETNA
jgi:hypothetical protein